MDEIRKLLQTAGLRGDELDSAIELIERFARERHYDGYEDGYYDAGGH